MATLGSVSIAYQGENSVGLFATITSTGGAGWEAVDAAELLPEVCKDEAIEFVRIEVPVETQQVPLATIGLVGEWTGAAGARTWMKHATRNHPSFQMLAADTNAHVFYIEYGRTHSRTR